MPVGLLGQLNQSMAQGVPAPGQVGPTSPNFQPQLQPPSPMPMPEKSPATMMHLHNALKRRGINPAGISQLNTGGTGLTPEQYIVQKMSQTGIAGLDPAEKDYLMKSMNTEAIREAGHGAPAGYFHDTESQTMQPAQTPGNPALDQLTQNPDPHNIAAFMQGNSSSPLPAQALAPTPEQQQMQLPKSEAELIIHAMDHRLKLIGKHESAVRDHLFQKPENTPAPTR